MDSHGPRCLRGPAVFCISAALTLSGISVFAGGVAIVGTELSDNGDDDGFADTSETVSLRLIVQNTTDIDLTGVVAQIRTEQWPLACIIGSLISIGDIGAGERLTTSEAFTFRVADDVERVSVLENLSLSFVVKVSSDQLADLALRQEATIAVDLDATGGEDPSVFLESFESGDLGTFTQANLDSGKYDLVASDGYRCQYHDPDWVICPWCPLDCFLGATSTQADAYHWQVDGPTSVDGGRAYTGSHSLYMGIFLPDDLGHTTPLAVLEAASMTDPIHIGLQDVCSGDRATTCQNDSDCLQGEACVPVMPKLSIKHQISLMDHRTVNARPGRAADRGVVQAQVADGAGVGDWIKLQPYLNVYDVQGEDNYYNCTFDPIDDGSTEDDLFDPTDPNRRLGPSSTCFPAFSFASIGDTVGPFNALHTGHASDGPGLPGSLGPGTWVESSFDLSRFRGRSIRLRFLNTSLKAGTYESWEDGSTLGPHSGDDGWWIDDVTVTDTVVTPALAIVDTKDNSGLPGVPGGDGDTDGVPDVCDNCPVDPNPFQDDLDVDGIGDVCDACPEDPDNDADGDGLCVPEDNCPLDVNPSQSDTDGDGLGDPCDPCPLDALNNDIDGDGLCPDVDNCPVDFNPLQTDTDADGVGNLCDVCPQISDPGQADADGDGVGDACDCQPVDPNDLRPAAVTQLTADRSEEGATVLGWVAAPGADVYSVSRGDLSLLALGSYGSCLAEGVDSTSYIDPELPLPGEGFFYLLQGQNYECGLGSLGFTGSEEERSNTDPGVCQGGPHADLHANAEASVFGSVSGSFADTTASDDVVEAITEKQSSDTPPTNRFSRLEHHWTIQVPEGSRIEFHVEGFRTTSPDGDDFVFDYSTDGVNWLPISLQSLPLSDDDTDLVAPLPSALSGSVMFRVVDTDRTLGNRALDTVSIDELFVRSVP